jgi:hypothetical protein
MTCYCEIFIDRNGVDVPCMVKARYIPAQPEIRYLPDGSGQEGAPAGWDIQAARLVNGESVELSVAEIALANDALWDELAAQPGRVDCELE